jgi:hypothetical protein
VTRPRPQNQRDERWASPGINLRAHGAGLARRVVRGAFPFAGPVAPPHLASRILVAFHARLVQQKSRLAGNRVTAAPITGSRQGPVAEGEEGFGVDERAQAIIEPDQAPALWAISETRYST